MLIVNKVTKHTGFRKMQRCKGFTLLELMIVLAISAGIALGVVNLMVTNTTAGNNVVETVHLNQQMRTLMEIMSSEIRKSGYWGAAATAGDAAPNPFGLTTVDSNPACIMFTFDDETANGILEPATETHGFRLNNQTVERHDSGGGCSSAGSWTALSDPNEVEITTMTLTLSTNCSNVSTSPISNCTVGKPGYQAPAVNDVTVKVNQVSILITGRSTSNPQNALTLQDTIVIRNDSIQRAI